MYAMLNNETVDRAQVLSLLENKQYLHACTSLIILEYKFLPLLITLLICGKNRTFLLRDILYLLLHGDTVGVRECDLQNMSNPDLLHLLVPRLFYLEYQFFHLQIVLPLCAGLLLMKSLQHLYLNLALPLPPVLKLFGAQYLLPSYLILLSNYDYTYFFLFNL